MMSEVPAMTERAVAGQISCRFSDEVKGVDEVDDGKGVDHIR